MVNQTFEPSEYLTEFSLSRYPILITGESGSGKTTLAREIHRLRVREMGAQRFVPVNIASLSEGLFERELFGHQKGAFTGARESGVGYFDEAQNGVLLIDEIGELSLRLQAKLLQVIESGIFYEVGGVRPKTFQGKLIFATHQNLENLVERKKFREDLLYRIKTLELETKSFNSLSNQAKLAIITKLQNQMIPNLHFSDELLNQILKCKWKGNLRELKQFFQYLETIYGKKSGILSDRDLPRVFKDKFIKTSKSFNRPIGYHEALEEFERNYLKSSLERNLGMVNRTCEVIGISKSTFVAKCKKYGISSQLIKLKANEPGLFKKAS